MVGVPRTCTRSRVRSSYDQKPRAHYGSLLDNKKERQLAAPNLSYITSCHVSAAY